MEKRRPHYPLLRVKALLRDGAYRVTGTALHCAVRDFGFVEASQLANRVLELEYRDFYKSMTTIRNSAIWQDVYRPQIEGIGAYVKLQIVEDTTVVVSFKSLEDD